MLFNLTVQIPLPIHLQRIETRLERGYYRGKAPLLWDLETLLANVKLFNEPGSDIVELAAQLVSSFTAYINGSPCMRCF
jgi:hypothetical protein